MGLRAFICVVVAFLKLQGSLADWESNEKTLKWIFDVKNAVTTQNQTFKQNIESGAFRYHYDVSAQNTYKYEVQSSDSVTMGCYGWKDAAERWHSTNYVADSHGWRTLHDIRQPVDVYPVFEEHTTRTFLDNVPQCLSFTADSAPRPSFVFTNHPPTPPTSPPGPFKQTIDDHVPHGSEHIHRIDTIGVPSVSILTTARPDSFSGTPPVGRPAVGHVGTSPGFTSTISGSHPNKFGELPNRKNNLEFEKQSPAAPLGPPPSTTGSDEELTNQPPNTPDLPTVELTDPGLTIPGKIPIHEQPPRTPGRPNVLHVGTSTGFTSTSGSRPSTSGEVPNTQTYVEFTERLGRPPGSTHNQVKIEKQSPGPLGPPPGEIVSGDGLTNRPPYTLGVIREPTLELTNPALTISGEIPIHEQPSRTPGRPNVLHVGTSTGSTSTSGSRPSTSGEVPNTQTYVEFTERLGRPPGSTHNQVKIEKQSPGPLGPPPSEIVTDDGLTNRPPYTPGVIREPALELTNPALTISGEIPIREQPSRTPGRPNLLHVGTSTGSTSTSGSRPSTSGEVPNTQTYVEFTERLGRPPGSTHNQVKIEKQSPGPSGPSPGIIISSGQPPRQNNLVPLGSPTSQPGSENILTGQTNAKTPKTPPITDTLGETLPHGPLEELSPEVTPAPSGANGDDLLNLNYGPIEIPTNKYDVRPPGRLDNPYISIGTPPGKQKPYTKIPSGPQSSETIFKKVPPSPIYGEPSKRPVTGAARGDRTWKEIPTAKPSQANREPIKVPSSKESPHPSHTTFEVVSTSRPYEDRSSSVPISQPPYDLESTPETPSRSTLLLDLPPNGPIEGTKPVLLRPYDSTGTGSSHTSRFDKIDPGRTPAYLPPPTTPLTHLPTETPIYLQTPDGPGPYCMCACPRG